MTPAPFISTGEKISACFEIPSTLPRIFRKDNPIIRLPRNMRHGYLHRTVRTSYEEIRLYSQHSMRSFYILPMFTDEALIIILKDISN